MLIGAETTRDYNIVPEGPQVREAKERAGWPRYRTEEPNSCFCNL